MWLGNVELPQSLVEAHQSGELVIFVGAGASVAEPSGLPNFKDLTSWVCRDFNVGTDFPPDYPFDRVLGQLDDSDELDVHARVVHYLNKPGSVPNELHHAIVSVARTSPAARIVTTNYDRHLSKALDASGTKYHEYLAPALPLGDDFDGLVYLHGSLNQEPRRMVVTDADFGRAYLSDAWAARFLERLFADKSVLFIGYSHSDVIMTYLARGLGRSKNRYVLTHDPAADNWKQLNILPVAYEVLGGSHAALPEMLQKWATRASMGLLDHRQQVRALVQDQIPSEIPEEMSYLEETLADSARVRFFTEYARDGQWLRWATSQEPFRSAVQGRQQDYSPSARSLMDWFAMNYAFSQEHCDAALSVIGELGHGHLNELVWDALGGNLHVSSAESNPVVRRWLVMMCRDHPSSSVSWLEYALDRCSWPRDSEVLILLLYHLAYPLPALRPGFSGGPRTEVTLQGEKFWLNKAWSEIVRPNIGSLAPTLLSMFDQHLRVAMSYLVNSSTLSADSPYISRITIEPSNHNWDHDDIDFLIDGARDCLESVVRDNPPYAAQVIESWMASGVVLLERLGLHGWRSRADVLPDEKLRWLIESGAYLDYRVKHEAYMLAADCLPQASPETIGALIEQISSQEVHEERRRYGIYNALVWVRRYAPEHSARRVNQAVSDATPADVDWGEREHPDLIVGPVSAGWITPNFPITEDALHERIEMNAAEGITALMSRERPTADPFDRYEEDLWALVTATVRKYPGDGLTLLDVEELPREGVTAVLAGWTATEVHGDLAAKVIGRVEKLDLATHYQGVASLLSMRTETSAAQWRSLEDARRLAITLWAYIPDDAEGGVTGGDILTESLNHPAGKLAEFWTLRVGDEWRRTGEEWAGLGDDLKAPLDTMLASSGRRGTMARAMLVTRLHMFAGADTNWCTEHLLPCLNWGSTSGAASNWDAYLSWGRWTPQLLAAGLFDSYLSTIDHVAELGSGSDRKLCEHFASLAVFGEGQFAASEWLIRFIGAANEEARVDWAEQVSQLLADLPIDAREAAWKEWGRAYWQRRLEGIPAALSQAEASAMVAWVLSLRDSFSEGLELVLSRPAGFTTGSSLLSDLTYEELGRSPLKFAALIEHLLTGTQDRFWKMRELARVVRDLRRLGLTELQMRPLLEAAARLGFYDN